MVRRNCLINDSNNNNKNKKDLTIKNYEMRKATIFKKAKELSTLCDIDALLIFYGPDNPNIPQTWCSKPDCMTVIRKLYGDEVVGDCGDKAGGSFGELSSDKLVNLDKVLAGKIAVVEQRIEVLKGSLGISGDFFDGLDFSDYMLDDNDGVMRKNDIIDGFGFGDAMSEVMMDVSDIDDIKFDCVEDDLDLIRRLAEVDDSGYGSEGSCVEDGDFGTEI